MEISKATTDQNEQYKIMRLGFIIFLLISPLLPYLITMAYNSYLLVTLPARARALPRYPEAKLTRGLLKEDTTGNCLQVIIQYHTDTPVEINPEKYEAILLQSGWHQLSGKGHYKKGFMHLDVGTANRYRLNMVLTADTLPLFQPGCLP